MGAIPLGIPYRDISEYARDLGLDSEGRQEFIEILTQMDAHFLTIKARAT